MTIDLSRCTSDTMHSTCQHPSTLTDSNTGGNTFNTEDYLVWKTTNKFSRLLFTFPTEISLHNITLHSYIERESNDDASVRLKFFAIPDEFELQTGAPEHRRLIHKVTEYKWFVEISNFSQQEQEICL